jgi:hypothetical protein
MAGECVIGALLVTGLTWIIARFGATLPSFMAKVTSHTVNVCMLPPDRFVSRASRKRGFLGDLNTALIFPQNALKHLLKHSFETFYPKSQFQIEFQETALCWLIIETD